VRYFTGYFLPPRRVFQACSFKNRMTQYHSGADLSPQTADVRKSPAGSWILVWFRPV